VKHATPSSLAGLKSLLRRIRSFPEIREMKTGVFYRKSRAFLHFHEDGDSLFADVRLESNWERFEVTTPPQREKLIKKLAGATAP